MCFPFLYTPMRGAVAKEMPLFSFRFPRPYIYGPHRSAPGVFCLGATRGRLTPRAVSVTLSSAALPRTGCPGSRHGSAPPAHGVSPFGFGAVLSAVSRPGSVSPLVALSYVVASPPSPRVECHCMVSRPAACQDPLVRSDYFILTCRGGSASTRCGVGMLQARRLFF